MRNVISYLRLVNQLYRNVRREALMLIFFAVNHEAFSFRRICKFYIDVVVFCWVINEEFVHQLQILRDSNVVLLILWLSAGKFVEFVESFFAHLAKEDGLCKDLLGEPHLCLNFVVPISSEVGQVQHLDVYYFVSGALKQLYSAVSRTFD